MFFMERKSQESVPKLRSTSMTAEESIEDHQLVPTPAPHNPRLSLFGRCEQSLEMYNNNFIEYHIYMLNVFPSCTQSPGPSPRLTAYQK